jgi:hypothetical protein
LPDSENAAILIDKASAVFTGKTPIFTGKTPVVPSYTFDPFHPGDTASWMDDTRAVIAAYDKTLSRLRQVRSLPNADWGMSVRGAAQRSFFTSAAVCRACARLLGCSALYYHNSGNDREALEYLRDALALGDRMNGEGTIIAWWVSHASDNFTLSILRRILPTIQIESSAVPNPGGHDIAGRKQVAALIGELLAEDSLRKDWERAQYTDRVIRVELTRQVRAGRLPPSAMGTLYGVNGNLLSTLNSMPPILLEPLWTMEGLEAMPPTSVVVEAARQRNYSVCLTVLSRASYAHNTSTDMDGNPDTDGTGAMRLLEHYFKRFAERRIAATALALRWFEIDHDRKPETLAELVPDYLPAVPIDPFSGNGTQIRYAPDARRPCVYSIGANGADDGGACELSNGQLLLHDIPFHLDGQPMVVERDTAMSVGGSEQSAGDADDHEDQNDNAGEHSRNN